MRAGDVEESLKYVFSCDELKHIAPLHPSGILPVLPAMMAMQNTGRCIQQNHRYGIKSAR